MFYSFMLKSSKNAEHLIIPQKVMVQYPQTSDQMYRPTNKARRIHSKAMLYQSK